MAPSPKSPIHRVVSPSSTLGSSPELGSSSLASTHMRHSPPISSALQMVNQSSSTSDVDMNVSIYQTPPTRAAELSSTMSSPQIVVMSPFSDIVGLSRTQSHTDFVSAAPSEMDDVLSFRSSLSSPISSTTYSLTDDEDSHHSLRGSDDEWAEVESDHSRH
jgi:hypothetical protein